MSYVYIQSEPGLWTTGFYDPSGKWQPESDHDSKEEAAQRVHYLNGHPISGTPDEMLVMRECHELARKGLSLNAIKLYKEKTGCSIAQAKNILGI